MEILSFLWLQDASYSRSFPEDQELAGAFQKYLYDGTSSVVVLFGHLYHGPKSDAVAATKKPDPNDPDVKMNNKLSDLQVDTYGDTAQVS